MVMHAPRAKVTHAIAGLGAYLNGEEAEAPTKRKGLFSFLGS